MSKVFIALSGGVDSAVSLALLKEGGYDCTGVFMKNWSGDDFGIQADCPWERDQKDAETVCMHLGVPFRSFNFEKQYREKVVEYFFDEYKKGRTPNPDVMCNKEIKFKLFLERALSEGADMIATGHYARRVTSYLTYRQAGELRVMGDTPPTLPRGGTVGGVNYPPQTTNYSLFKGVDPNKDQTYFLYNITQEQLSHVLFPIGHLHKPEVRELARKYKLPNAEKPDSQGICFIGEINVLKFLMSQIPEMKGEIKDIDTGKVVGEHKGIYFYTIGQREGLGIGGQEIPYFVVDKDSDENILYVGHGNDHPAMFKQIVTLETQNFASQRNIHWIAGYPPNDLSGLTAAIRYRQKPQKGEMRIMKTGDRILETGNPSLPSPLVKGEVLRSDGGVVDFTKTMSGKQSPITFKFDQPQRAVTSGQSLVIYKGEECLGGGIIR